MTFQRGKEFGDKTAAAIKEAVGDRAAKMFSLEHLATTPAKQGHGYGTALCEVLNEIVSNLVRYVTYP